MVEGNMAHLLSMVLFGKNLNLGFIRVLSRDYALFGSFSIEICQFFLFSLDTLVWISWWQCYIFYFSHLIIRGLIERLITYLGRYSTLCMKTYRYIVDDSSAPREEFLKSIFKFSHLLIRGLIEGLCPN